MSRIDLSFKNSRFAFFSDILHVNHISGLLLSVDRFIILSVEVQLQIHIVPKRGYKIL